MNKLRKALIILVGVSASALASVFFLTHITASKIGVVKSQQYTPRHYKYAFETLFTNWPTWHYRFVENKVTVYTRRSNIFSLRANLTLDGIKIIQREDSPGLFMEKLRDKAFGNPKRMTIEIPSGVSLKDWDPDQTLIAFLKGWDNFDYESSLYVGVDYPSWNQANKPNESNQTSEVNEQVKSLDN